MVTKSQIGFLNTALLVLGIAASSLYAPRAAAQQAKTPQEVHVANIATDPVPVKIDATTNTIKIDGTTNTVQANQKGVWNVGLTGTPIVTLAPGAAVQIANPVTSPAVFRDVDRLTSQPVRATLTSTFPDGNSASITPGVTYTVPFGKRLVIEFVTANIVVPFGQVATFARLDASGNFNQYLALTLTGPDGSNKPNFVGTHRTFVILEPNTVVEAFGVRNSGTGIGTVNMTISGYLADI